MLKEEYKSNATVKTLLSAGFSEDYILKSIETGDIKLEKSKDEKEMDESLKREKENVANDKKHLKDLKRDEEEDEQDEKDLKRDKKVEADAMEKAITANLLKSMGDTLGNVIAESIAPLFKGMNARFDAQEAAINNLKKQAPEFKSGDLGSASVLEKSLETYKGEDGKISMNIITQRPAVKKLIEKSLENPDFMKSFGDEVASYLMYPEADTVSENVARYMYEKMGVKLVK